MRLIERRLRKNEDRLTPPDFLLRPREHLRVVVHELWRPADLEASTCTRTLSDDGMLLDIVQLAGHLDTLNN